MTALFLVVEPYHCDLAGHLYSSPLQLSERADRHIVVDRYQGVEFDPPGSSSVLTNSAPVVQE